MNTMTRILLGGLLTVYTISPADAQLAEIRTWTSKQGSTVDARLLDVSGPDYSRKVKLETRDGRVIEVPKEVLSAGDSGFIDQLEAQRERRRVQSLQRIDNADDLHKYVESKRSGTVIVYLAKDATGIRFLKDCKARLNRYKDIAGLHLLVLVPGVQNVPRQVLTCLADCEIDSTALPCSGAITKSAYGHDLTIVPLVMEPSGRRGGVAKLNHSTYKDAFDTRDIDDQYAKMFDTLTFKLDFILGVAPEVLADDAPATTTASGGIVSLFDGKTLAGWIGDKRVWRVKNGYIEGYAPAGAEPAYDQHGHWLVTKHQSENFDFRIKFRCPSGNSGIQFRSKFNGDGRMEGYQADITSTGGLVGAIFYEPSGFLCRPDRDVVKNAFRVGDWNEYRIVARGFKCAIYLNGKLTTEFEDDRSRSGFFGVQLYGSNSIIHIKDIELRTL